MKKQRSHLISQFYRIIVAVMLLLILTSCGDKSDPTDPVQAPTVSLTAPVTGDTLTGSVQISVNATNATLVRFYCDGTEIGNDSSAPYSFSWNSASVSDGTHTLKVQAEGTGGTAEAQIQVMVHNNQTGVIVSVTPGTVSIQLGQTQQFSALVTGTANTAVTWTVVEGNAWGTITSTGLYTAPAVLPAPATATIKATSAADPTKSAIASVTLSAGSVPPEVITLVQGTFNSAYDVADLGDESVDLAAEAVWGASGLNGGALTLTGTLTQTAQGSDVWTYSPTPSNKLLVVYAGGPTIELEFSAFNGYLNGTWQDFTEQHQIDFTIFIQGQTDIRVQSQSGFVMGGPTPEFPRNLPEWDRQWQRTITGNTVYEGETYTLNVTHQGAENGSIEPGWTYLAHDETYVGTINSASAQMNISQSSYTSRLHDSNSAIHVLNGQLTNNSSATMNNVTYQFHNAHAAWAAGSSLNDPGAFNIVIDTNYWAAQGNVTRDGQPFGNIQFTGPVVANAYGGPDLVLHLTTGEDIFLHTLVPYP